MDVFQRFGIPGQVYCSPNDFTLPRDPLRLQEVAVILCRGPANLHYFSNRRYTQSQVVSPLVIAGFFGTWAMQDGNYALIMSYAGDPKLRLPPQAFTLTVDQIGNYVRIADQQQIEALLN